MRKTNEALIHDLHMQIENNLKTIEIYKTMVKNYEVIVAAYKDMIKDDDDKKQTAINLIEIDRHNVKAMKNAFLILSKQNLLLKRELRNFKDNNKYDNIVRKN